MTGSSQRYVQEYVLRSGGGRLRALPLHKPVVSGNAEGNMIKDLGVAILKRFRIQGKLKTVAGTTHSVVSCIFFIS